jgi:5-methylcytosine-specific restriction endonuclease McrA
MGQKYRFSAAERYGVWTCHGHKCFWCEEPINFKETTVDHLIPESIANDRKQFAMLKKTYSLPRAFQINGFENLVPSHNACNVRKGARVFKPSPAFVEYIDRAARLADCANSRADKVRKYPEDGRRIAVAIDSIERKLLTVDELVEFRPEDVRERTEFMGAPASEPQRRILPADVNLSNDWRVRTAPPLPFVLAADFVHNLFGISTLQRPAHPSWTCSQCGFNGPWEADLCLNCGTLNVPSTELPVVVERDTRET